MSEHQVYEFLATDRPLTDAQMRELRDISSRADITSTRFWNEYHWGDLKADPLRLISGGVGRRMTPPMKERLERGDGSCPGAFVDLYRTR